MKTIVWFGFVLCALPAAAKVFVARPRQKAIIECDFSTYSTLEWNRGGSLIVSVNGKTGFPRKGNGDIAERSKVRQSNLEISTVKEQDAGKFTCRADGKSQEHTLLVFSISATPSSELVVGSDATLQCQVKGLSPEPQVQWRKPNSDYTESGTVHLKPVVSSDEGIWNCMFSHDGVHTESLSIKLKGRPTTPPPLSPQILNDVPKPACPNCNPGPSNPAQLLGLQWWVWVAIGVGCLVVILLLVFVIVLCKRIKRRKMMMNGHQPLQSKQYCQCNRPAAAAKPQQRRRREKPSALPLHPS